MAVQKCMIKPLDVALDFYSAAYGQPDQKN